MDIGPLVRIPFLDQRTGLISRPWLLFMLGLFERTGGTAGSAVDNVQIMDEYDDIAHALMYQNEKRIEDVALLSEFSPNVPASTYDVSMEFPQGLPQDLQRGSSPTFVNITATGNMVVTGDVKAATYHVGASAGVDFGPAAVASITVKKGIVTAIS